MYLGLGVYTYLEKQVCINLNNCCLFSYNTSGSSAHYYGNIVKPAPSMYGSIIISYIIMVKNLIVRRLDCSFTVISFGLMLICITYITKTVSVKPA